MAGKVKIGNVGFFVKAIKDYLDADDSDPELKTKKKKAKKAVDHLETIFGVTPDEAKLVGCAADNLWIE